MRSNKLGHKRLLLDRLVCSGERIWFLEFLPLIQLQWSKPPSSPLFSYKTLLDYETYPLELQWVGPFVHLRNNFKVMKNDSNHLTTVPQLDQDRAQLIASSKRLLRPRNCLESWRSTIDYWITRTWFPAWPACTDTVFSMHFQADDLDYTWMLIISREEGIMKPRKW